MFDLVKYLVLMTVLVEWLSIDRIMESNPRITFTFQEITLVHQVLLGSCVLESTGGHDEEIRLYDSEERKYQ